MILEEICQLTPESIAALLHQRRPAARAKSCRRRSARSAFPSTVELWIPRPSGADEYILATSLNLSERGIGIQSEVPLTVGANVGIAVHEPEATLHGYARVCYCNPNAHGYRIGLEFLFPTK